MALRGAIESIIREHLDLGRPDNVQLIFERRITRRTPSRFRTRVIQQGVVPSLHVDYKHSRLKQYHKEGLALRTETTVNDTRDFYIGRSLRNLPEVRRISGRSRGHGFSANRRLLSVQWPLEGPPSLDCDPTLGAEIAQQINRPKVALRGAITVEQQRASALRFDESGPLRGHPTTQALFSALVMFVLVPNGFIQRELRAAPAPGRRGFAVFLGLSPDQITSAQKWPFEGPMTYHLRRLRLHGLKVALRGAITRITGTHRYLLTQEGYRAVYFETRLYAHVFQPGLARLHPDAPVNNSKLRAAFDRLDDQIQRFATAPT